MAADKQALLAVVLAVKRGLVSPEDGMKILEEAESESSPDLEQTLYAHMPEADREELRQEAHELAGDPEQATIALNEAGIPQDVQQTLLQIDTARPAGKESIEATLLSVAPSQADTEIERPNLPSTEERYRVLREHARGGMGRILVALDKTVGREVALKELLPGRGGSTARTPTGSSTGAEARFLREATVTGQLEHPNIVPVYEIGQRDDGQLYYTMKFVRGRTLQTRLRAIRNDPDLGPSDKLNERLKLLDHFVDICQAIAYAHSRGVIHRDLKPANIMLGDFGETLVLDWGLARVRGVEDRNVAVTPEMQSKEANLTLDGEVMGTPAYMPPEQAAGKTEQVDERSDVYSLGAIMFEIVTGEAPFGGKTAKQVLSSVLNEEPRKVENVTPDAPPELAALIRKSMARNPAERFQTARELSEQVQAFRDGRMVSTYKYSAMELARRFVAKNKAAVLISLLALVALIGGGAYAYSNVVKERDAALAAEQESERQKGIAVIKAEEANDARREAEDARAFAEQKADEADAERERADQKAKDARRAENQAKDALARATASDNEAKAALKTARKNLAATHLALADAAKAEGRLSDKLIHTAAARVQDPEEVSDTLLLGALSDAVFPVWTSRAYMDLPAEQVSFSGDRRLMAAPMHAIPEGLDSWSWAGVDTAFADIGIWDVASGTLLRRIHTGEKVGRIVRLSADGKTVYSHDFNGLLRSWDVATGENRIIRRANESYPLKFVIDPRGSVACTANNQGKLRILSLTRDAVLNEIQVEGAEFTALDISEDGTRIAAGTFDGRVMVWQTDTLDRVAEMSERGNIECLRFTTDGLLVAPGGADIELWSADLQTRLRSFTRAAFGVSELVHGPYGKYLGANLGTSGWRLYDYTSGELITEEKANAAPILGLAFTPDGAHMLAVHKGDGLRVIETASGTHLREEEGHRLACLYVAISPDGRLVASGGFDSRVIVQRMTDGAQVWAQEYDSTGVYGVEFSPDGEMIVVSCRNGKIYGLDASNGAIRFSHKMDLSFNLTFSNDGEHIACVDNSGKVLVINKKGETRREYSFQQGMRLADAQFAPGDRMLWIGAMNGGIYTWNWQGSEPPQRRISGDPEVPEALFGLELSDDGKLLCAHQWNGDIKVYETEGMVVKWTRNFAASGQYNANFGHKGKFLVLGGADGLIRYVDASNGVVVRKHRAHRSSILGVALSPSGRDIITTAIDGMVAAWETPAFMYPNSYEFHDNQVFDLEVSHDGRKAASCSSYGVVRVWEIESERLVAEIDLREGWSTGMAFSPDAELLAVGNSTGRVILWNLLEDREERTIRVYDSIIEVDFDAQNRLVVAGYYHGVQVLDATSGEVVLHHEVEKYTDYSFRMFPDGNRYLFSPFSGEHEIRSLESGEVISTVSRGADYYGVVAISPDGETLATHRKSGLISLHRTDTGELYHYVQARDESPLALHFLPRSDSLVYFTSGSADTWGAGGAAYIVDIRTGREAASTRLESTFTNTSAIAPDGSFVLICDSRGGIERWDLSVQQRQRQALGKLSAEDQLDVVQELAGLKLNQLETEPVPKPLGRASWLTEDAQAPAYLQATLPAWVPQLDGKAGTAAEIYLAERKARRRARIELDAHKWLLKFEGHRYREELAPDLSIRRIYFPPRDVDPSGNLVGEAQGRIDYAHWLKEEQRKQERILKQRIAELLERGERLQSDGELKGAKAMFERLRRLEPKKAEWVIRFAQLASRTGESWSAQSACEEYLRDEECERRGDVMLQYARSLADGWSVQNMRDQFDKAREAGYDRDDWYVHRARGLEDSGAYREAIAFVQTAMLSVSDPAVKAQMFAISARCQNWLAVREQHEEFPVVLVVGVPEGSHAQQAGLRMNDVIVSFGEGDFHTSAFDARTVHSGWSFFLDLAARDVESTPMIVRRNGEEITLQYPREPLDADLYTVRPPPFE